MRTYVLLICLAVSGSATLPLTAQSASCGGTTPFQILHFTKTNGFDHKTRSQSAQLFTELGQLNNFTVVDTESETVFDDLNTLLTYEVIVFSNTSGNNLLNAAQRPNVEAYIAAGGSFLGIHAATDTYRDQIWPFYNQLVGGIVQTQPNHTAQNFDGTMDVIGDHPSTANLPDPWDKREEYYYWEINGGQLAPGIIETLRVRSTGSESYDAPRPMAWYQEFPSGARSYYTALGHAASNYTDPNNDFRQLLRDALCWCVLAEASVATEEPDPSRAAPFLRANLVRDELVVWLPQGRDRSAKIYSLSGREVPITVQMQPGSNRIAVGNLPAGTYVLRFADREIFTLRFVKQ